MAFSTRVVDDLDTLKAVSHPIRTRLLGLLRADGPATASALGRRIEESSGSTSYHLRQLERFGFVTDDDDQPSRRERRWRAVHDMTSFPADLVRVPGGRELLDQVQRRQLEILQEGLAALSEPTRGFSHSDYQLRLDTHDLEALATELEEVIARYSRRTGEHDVSLHVLALPRTS
jgi:DNA-binding transcriptional ArsR family regulator